MHTYLVWSFGLPNPASGLYAGELFFITDRNNGFWNIYKWVSYTIYQQDFIVDQALCFVGSLVLLSSSI